MVDIDTRVTQWLQQAGFVFDPFYHLEASQDDHLLDFLVIYEDLKQAWEKGSALVVAPVGGGKTALCHYVTWVSRRGLQPFFAVLYVLARYWEHRPPATVAAQASGLGQALARSLLFQLLTFPQVFLDFAAADQGLIRSWLWRVYREMPLMLARWRAMLDSPTPTTAWQQLLGDLAGTAQIAGYAPPPRRHLQEVGELLQRSENNLRPAHHLDSELLGDFLSFIRQVYGSEIVLFLVDGMDAFMEGGDHDKGRGKEQVWMQNWLESWMVSLPDFVHFKAFIPPSWVPANIPSKVARVEFRWTKPLLTEVIRRRVMVATAGRFDSLDAIAESGIRNSEKIIVDQIGALLPRELILFVRRIFLEHIISSPDDALLREDDIYKTYNWYKNLQFHS
jgi:hypothetical protein